MLAAAVRNESTISVPCLAEHYLEVIRESFRNGPFKLMGFCFGGMLAYEVARRATAAGAKVELLVMVDTPLWTRIPFSRSKWITHHMKGLQEEGLTYLTGRVSKKLGLERAAASSSTSAEPNEEATARVGALARRVRNYEPEGGYEGRALLIRADDPALFVTHRESRLLGWDDFLHGRVGVEFVSGAHSEIMTQPYVSAMGRLLGGYLGN